MKEHFGHSHRDKMSCTGTFSRPPRSHSKRMSGKEFVLLGKSWNVFLFSNNHAFSTSDRWITHRLKNTSFGYFSLGNNWAHLGVGVTQEHIHIHRHWNVQTCWLVETWKLHPRFRFQCGRWVKKFAHPYSMSLSTINTIEVLLVDIYYWMIQFQSALWLCARSSWWCGRFRISVTLVHSQWT